jgi:CheY-like chemotaxis protein
MPVMDGPETIRRIRDANEEWATVPVIALTADAMSGDRERLLALGMSGYVSKPIDQRELIAEICRVRDEVPHIAKAANS